jgi:DNA-binding MarR family transcriptional regulator
MPASKTDDPSLFRLFNEVGIVAQLSQRIFESVMPAGMTLAQFSILNHFVRLGGEKSPAQLADAFQLTRATMTSTLGRLSEKGFVAIAPDPADGRAKRVAITDAGRRMRDSCVTALGPEIERLVGLIEGESVLLLIEHLTRIRKVLDADRASGLAASA